MKLVGWWRSSSEKTKLNRLSCKDWTTLCYLFTLKKTGTTWHILWLVTGEVSHSHMHSQERVNVPSTCKTHLRICLEAIVGYMVLRHVIVHGAEARYCTWCWGTLLYMVLRHVIVHGAEARYCTWCHREMAGARYCTWCYTEMVGVRYCTWCYTEMVGVRYCTWCYTEMVGARYCTWCYTEMVGARYCTWCYTEMAGARYCTWCYTEMAGWRYCTWCHREMAGARYCTWCHREMAGYVIVHGATLRWQGQVKPVPPSYSGLTPDKQVLAPLCNSRRQEGQHGFMSPLWLIQEATPPPPPPFTHTLWPSSAHPTPSFRRPPPPPPPPPLDPWVCCSVSVLRTTSFSF